VVRGQDDGNPLLHGLVWALVAIGVLGGGIWAAQKHYFNNDRNKPALISESKPTPTPAQAPTSVPPVKDKPSPLPSRASPSRDHIVEFVTDPPGARIIVDLQSDPSCRTPCMLTLLSGRHVLKAQLDGYRDYSKIITVPQQDNTWFMKLSNALGSLVLP
jgi:hypothetical protein